MSHFFLKSWQFSLPSTKTGSKMNFTLLSSGLENSQHFFTYLILQNQMREKCFKTSIEWVWIFVEVSNWIGATRLPWKGGSIGGNGRLHRWEAFTWKRTSDSVPFVLALKYERASSGFSHIVLKSCRLHLCNGSQICPFSNLLFPLWTRSRSSIPGLL